MLRKPNLFLIGYPRCGTTSIFHYLNEHSEIFIPELKEIGYFKEVISKEEYLRLYTDRKEKYLGDFTPSYIFSNVTLKRILICIRNKKEAVESFLFNAKKAGHILSRKKVEELYNFDRIISVKKLFDHVHVINIDEFNKNPKKHYIKIIEFLELEKPIKYPSFKLYGERRYAKSPIIYKLLKNMTLRKIADFLPIPTRVRKIFFKLDRWSKEGEIIHDKKHKTK